MGGATWPRHLSISAFWPEPALRCANSRPARPYSSKATRPTEFYVIQCGKVDIRLGNRLLGTLSDHDIFGEMALIDAAPRSATAIAATDVKLVPVGEKQFLFLVSRTPHFALNIMRVLARRLRAQSSVM